MHAMQVDARAGNGAVAGDDEENTDMEADGESDTEDEEGKDDAVTPQRFNCAVGPHTTLMSAAQFAEHLPTLLSDMPSRKISFSTLLKPRKVAIRVIGGRDYKGRKSFIMEVSARTV
jgi:hypothetical protein